MFGAIAGGIASALAGGAMSKLFGGGQKAASRSEERFSRNAETDLVCRLLLEKKNHLYNHQRLALEHNLPHRQTTRHTADTKVLFQPLNRVRRFPGVVFPSR